VQYIFSKAKIPEFRGEVTAAKPFLKKSGGGRMDKGH